MAVIKHIIASGCSFTSDGIGGLPPSPLHPLGGCSYVADPDYPAQEPKSWIGHVAKKLNANSLVNLAAASHGNLMVANNILSLLGQYSYSPKDTLILFNISDPARLDAPCSWDHPDRCSFCDWGQDILSYTYLKRDSQPINYMSKNIGLEQVEILSSNALEGMMAYLELNKFNFKFLLMTDYKLHPTLGPVIDKFKSHLIEMENLVGMREFVQAFNLNSQDQLHPDDEGHRRISEIVLEKLSKEL